MEKLWSISLTVLLFAAFATTAYAADEEYVDTDWSDVNVVAQAGESDYLEGASDWAVAEITVAYEDGYLEDVEDILANYQGNITRQQFCHLIINCYEAMGGFSLPVANPFTDTDDSDVITAYALGIVTGATTTTFEPEAYITREQMATMIFRAINLFSVATVDYDISAFSDVGEISDYALEAVTYMNQIGVMKGYSETRLAPQEHVTCEQAILMTVRTIQNFY